MNHAIVDPLIYIVGIITLAVIGVMVAVGFLDLILTLVAKAYVRLRHRWRKWRVSKEFV